MFSFRFFGFSVCPVVFEEKRVYTVEVLYGTDNTESHIHSSHHLALSPCNALS